MRLRGCMVGRRFDCWPRRQSSLSNNYAVNGEVIRTILCSDSGVNQHPLFPIKNCKTLNSESLFCCIAIATFLGIHPTCTFLLAKKDSATRFSTSGFVPESVSPKPLTPLTPVATGKIFNQKIFNYFVWTPLISRVNKQKISWHCPFKRQKRTTWMYSINWQLESV